MVETALPAFEAIAGVHPASGRGDAKLLGSLPEHTVVPVDLVLDDLLYMDGLLHLLSTPSQLSGVGNPVAGSHHPPLLEHDLWSVDADCVVDDGRPPQRLPLPDE